MCFHLFIAAFCCGNGLFLRAQEVRATMGGRVTDEQGAVVPNAAVTVVSEDTNVKQQTRTNNQGLWTVQFLVPGHYRFVVNASGFKSEERRNIELQASDNRQFDVQLQLGSSAQTIQVTADPPLIDTTSATVGTVITEQEINDLPSQSHVATLLATLSPGVVAQYQNGNVVHLWCYNGASQFTANGGRNNIYSNDYRLDGMPDTKAGGDISFIPAQDSLAQFRVATNAYDAAIERQAGSTINMQTKSGGDRYHGSAYEYNQNSLLNANLFQTNLVGGAVPPVHFNEFGFTVGGPVWIPKVYNGKEKTFFFISWDYTNNTDPRPGSTRSVPTALERTGDFSQSFTTQVLNGKSTRFPILVYDPSTVDKNGNRQLFPRPQV
ncbi:MAG: carboxypeptidase regulatory-like domain-containing protein [Acidobacteriaceae bacterium]|nr:carboxypeptidase regulatory-like domain-containing protein [Acidobacteriaceae bacterium]